MPAEDLVDDRNYLLCPVTRDDSAVVEEVVRACHTLGIHDSVQKSRFLGLLLLNMILGNGRVGVVVVEELAEQEDGVLVPDGLVEGGEKPEKKPPTA